MINRVRPGPGPGPKKCIEPGPGRVRVSKKIIRPGPVGSGSTNTWTRRALLYAVRNLKKGDLVGSDEERPLRLVSYQYASENWSEQKMRYFHSCDPNVWINGLQFIARRDMACGEELTIDYATVLPSHPTFRCSCGTGECRTMIQPNEYREEWFEKRYGTHVSSYVRMLMEINEMKRNMQPSDRKLKDQQSDQNEK